MSLCRRRRSLKRKYIGLKDTARLARDQWKSSVEPDERFSRTDAAVNRNFRLSEVDDITTHFTLVILAVLARYCDYSLFNELPSVF